MFEMLGCLTAAGSVDPRAGCRVLLAAAALVALTAASTKIQKCEPMSSLADLMAEPSFFEHTYEEHER